VGRQWVESIGVIASFSGRVLRDVLLGRVMRFFGEALRQAGVLILSSTLVICGLVFIIGLQCGIEGAYFLRAQGSPAYAGVFAAWCDLRELVPYAFGYMMAAKVGTGIVVGRPLQAGCIARPGEPNARAVRCDQHGSARLCNRRSEAALACAGE
jgi:phospholipid/cholesterol/gamma-HCH transport system permease protein